MKKDADGWNGQDERGPEALSREQVARLYGIPMPGVEIPEAEDADEPFTYARVTLDGSLVIERGTWTTIRAAVRDSLSINEVGLGSIGTDFMSGCYPVRAFYSIAPVGPVSDTRRINKVAEGMAWRLDPDNPGEARERYRGTVVFAAGISEELTEEHGEQITDAHAKTSEFLRGRGWI